MPVYGGHSVCWSFYAAVDDALEAGDTRRLRLLAEVGNQVTIRLRLKPSAHQLVLDRLSMADELRIKAFGSGVESFFEFCCDIFKLPKIADSEISGPKLVDVLKEFGVSYRGKPIDKSLAYAILAIKPYALDSTCRDTVAFLERIDPRAFEDHSKVTRCCQRIKAFAPQSEHNEYFTYAVENMAVGLLAGNTKDASVFTVENLLGKAKGEAGFMKTNVTKKRLAAWFLNQVGGEISTASGVTSITTDGYQKLRRWFMSPHKFYTKFARARSAAEQEKCSLRALISDNLATSRRICRGRPRRLPLSF